MTIRAPRPVQHPGSCGERVAAPCGATLDGPYRLLAEVHETGVLCHGCGHRYRPGDLPMAATGAACAAVRGVS
ncbi:MAG: hypothetical protein KF809_04125 [Chloroflexi bacterium]|nr:hypothetical protein [Chloroflexota bacterium]